MTKREQRISIAIKCGWKANSLHPGTLYPPDLSEATNLDQIFELPNYHGDLNCMHQAEKCLKPNECNKYEILLGLFNSITDPVEVRYFHRTADQRADAFCRLFWPERFGTK